MNNWKQKLNRSSVDLRNKLMKRATGSNRYAEPHSLNGYYNMIGPDGRLRWYPVYSQTEMASTIADVPFRTPYSTYGKLKWYLANKAKEQALFDANPEAKYIMKDVVKNNIFSENDLLEPLDTHVGNFMYGKDGVLRATDIHKQGGKLETTKPNTLLCWVFLFIIILFSSFFD